MDADRCVCCGRIIPEGRMVCLACEGEQEVKRDSRTINCPANDIPKQTKDMMWHFLMKGGQKADIPALEEAVNDLCRSAMQKNAGNRKDKKSTDINWARDLDSIMWRIVIGATALVLSGELGRIEKYDLITREAGGKEKHGETD